MNRKQKLSLISIIITGAALAALNILSVSGHLRLLLFLALYVFIGFDTLRKTWSNILKHEIFDESFLMTAATLGAFALAINTGSGQYNEAIAVMLLFKIGELFEDFAVNQSRRSIKAVMDIRPAYANLEKQGKIVRTNPDEVEAGSVIIVNPGERAPIDGIIREGRALLNTSALTGESLPREAGPGDTILSGCISIDGSLRVQTVKSFRESAASKILELVESAASHKSKSEKFITKFARLYTPLVCLLALLTALAPPLVRAGLFSLSPDWRIWFYRALIMLVISCPCALVISIPLSFFAGLGGAGRQGILIKGSDYLEALADISCIAFDKTGTLTQGVFEVNDVHHNSLEKAKLIEYAALAETASSHPISRGLCQACGGELDRARVKDVTEIAGMGLTAAVDGQTVAVGSGRLMEKLGIEYKECSSAGAVVHAAVNGEYAGHIVISDKLKPNAAAGIEALRELNIGKIVLLSGDSQKISEEIADPLKLDAVYGGLLPQEKVAKIRELSAENNGNGKLAFVGDGINDAPVLAAADVGIAMGAMGSDAAVEAADAVIMDDDPLKAAKAVKIARRCMGIVYENIILALSVKILCLILGAAGYADMWPAIFADVGVMVLAVLNALRALYTKRL